MASGWEKLDTVHFNSCSPDFGTVPRRGIVWYEATDRPIGDGHASGNNRFAQYELSDDKDEGRRVWREKLHKMLYHRASVEEHRGHWGTELHVFEEYARRLGWTGNVRDRVEALGQFIE